MKTRIHVDLKFLKATTIVKLADEAYKRGLNTIDELMEQIYDSPKAVSAQAAEIGLAPSTLTHIIKRAGLVVRARAGSVPGPKEGFALNAEQRLRQRDARRARGYLFEDGTPFGDFAERGYGYTNSRCKEYQTLLRRMVKAKMVRPAHEWDRIRANKAQRNTDGRPDRRHDTGRTAAR